MGWKISSVIIHPKTNIEFAELLKNLGFNNLTKVEDESFDSAMYPENNKIFIGTYKNSIIISAANLPFIFYTESLSEIENKFIDIFPNAEICAVSLQSVTNHYGFAVIKDGKKIRVKSGNMDNPVIIDIGEPLYEELELLSKSKTNEDGVRMYYTNTYEPSFDDQVGENFIFEIFKRYTGNLLPDDDDLQDTIFSGYQIQETEFSLDNFFSGEWHGYYVYGDGYKENIKGAKKNFVLNMKVINGVLEGEKIDEDKQHDAPAKIFGFIYGRFINFNLQYPVHYMFDKNGGIQKNISQPSKNIAYTGLYDILTESFKGMWNIENTKFWGEWSMKKNNFR